MSYAFYKTLHLISIVILFSTYGAMIFARLLQREGEEKPRAWGMLMALHGVSLATLFVTGFGLIVKLGLSGNWPTWLWVKVGLWLVIGGVVAIIKRAKGGLLGVFFAVIALASATVYVAVHKPGPAPTPPSQAQPADEVPQP